jgi:nitrate/nitrite transport system ATP-binding protein
MNQNDRYLEFSRLSKSFGTQAGRVEVVKDFDLRIREGELVCLIGHSGCGKSTVLSIAAGLESATLGGAILDGREIAGPGTERGVVFQSACLLPWMSALDNVLLAVSQVSHAPKAEQRATAEHYLSLVGLSGMGRRMPAELSAGMRQRVGIARAFALSPKVLLLDEPFGMLDSLTRFELQDVLVDLWMRDRKTALMVTHDVDEAIFLSDRIAMMTSGPHAHLGGTLDIPFGRPRARTEIMETSTYYDLRERLLAFLSSEALPAPTKQNRKHDHLSLAS